MVLWSSLEPHIQGIDVDSYVLRVLLGARISKESMSILMVLSRMKHNFAVRQQLCFILHEQFMVFKK